MVMTKSELDQQYRGELDESITSVNRIAAAIGIVVTSFLMVYADPANFRKEVSISTLGFDVLPHMLIGRIMGIVACVICLIIALVPILKRFAFYGGIFLYFGTVIQCVHLAASMGNFDASVTAWIMLSVMMIAIYPLPLIWTLCLAVLGYLYYFVAFFGFYDGMAELANAKDPQGQPQLRFMMTLINTGATALLSLALKYTLQRIRRKEFDSRKGLEHANVEIEKLNDKLRDENLKLSHELEVARHIQEIVLPAKAEYGSFPELDIACKMIPATEVGGDYYDTIHLSSNGIFSIGDVTDHGLQSGIIMMMVHTAIRSVSQIEQHDLKAIYNVVNKIVYEFRVKTNDYRFMSLLILKYLGEGVFRMTGQHESVIIIRNNGDIEEISSLDLGMYAGLDKDIDHLLKIQEFQLQSGDTLVLYTDGITEAMNAKQAEFGKEGLIQAAKSVHGEGAEAIKEQVLSQCFAHLNGATVHDDLSLLVIKRR